MIALVLSITDRITNYHRILVNAVKTRGKLKGQIITANASLVPQISMKMTMCC